MGDASYAIEGWRVITAVGPHQMLLRSELSDRATARPAMRPAGQGTKRGGYRMTEPVAEGQAEEPSQTLSPLGTRVMRLSGASCWPCCSRISTSCMGVSRATHLALTELQTSFANRFDRSEAVCQRGR
jgi:hypothetical protein